MTRTTITRALTGLATAGLASVVLVGTATTGHADEINPYLGWDEPARPGECQMLMVKGRDFHDAGTATFGPEEHNSGWIRDSHAQDAAVIGDKNTRWAQNAVVEARVTIECDYERQAFTRHYAPTKYQHRFAWSGSQCILHWRSSNSGCMPYVIPGTRGGWRDGLAGTLR